MIVYNFMVLYLFTLDYISEKFKINKIKLNKSKIYKIILIMIPFFLLASLRSANIGNDTIYYHNLFLQSSNYSLIGFIDAYSYRYETGFLVLVKLCSSTFTNPQSLIFISSIVSLSLVAYTIHKYSINYAASMFVFLTLRYYFFYMSNIRQSLAISIVLLSFTFILQKKFIKFTIIIAIASLFHSTALVFLPVYFLSENRFDFKKYSYVFAFSILFYIYFYKLWSFILNYLPLKYQNYENTTYFIRSDNIANILNLLVFLTIFLLIYFLKNDKNTTYNYFLKFSFFAVIFGILSLRFGMFGRIQHYFSVFSIISLPNVLLKSQRGKNIFIMYIFFIMFLLYQNIVLYYRPEWQHVYPYEFFWKGVK